MVLLNHPATDRPLKFRWVPCLAMVATTTGRSMRRMGGCCRMKWMQDVSCYLTVKGSSTNPAHAPWYMNPIALQQRPCWRQASPSKQQLDWDAVGLQTVVSRPRFGCQVAWWWRGGGASQAEPGTSAKGHLADRTLVSISVSSLLS
jgi:hypothetical protein